LYRTVNRCIGLIFVTQIVLCVISASLFGTWSKKWEGDLWYMGRIFRVRGWLTRVSWSWDFFLVFLVFLFCVVAPRVSPGF
jgi:hypothetical protein